MFSGLNIGLKGFIGHLILDAEDVIKDNDEDIKKFSEYVIKEWPSILIRIAVGIAVIVLASIIVKAISRKIKARRGDSKKLRASNAMLTLLAVVVIFIAFTIVISCFGVSMTTVVYTLIAFIIAVLISLKEYISAIASGVIILITRPFTIGDIIQFDDMEGIVTSISMVHTVVKNDDLDTIYIPNNKITEEVVVNLADVKKAERIIDIEPSFSTSVDTKLVLDIFAEVIHNSSHNIKKGVDEECVVLKITSREVTFRGSMWVKTKDAMDAKNSVLTELVKSLKEKNVNISLDIAEILNTFE